MDEGTETIATVAVSALTDLQIEIIVNPHMSRRGAIHGRGVKVDDGIPADALKWIHLPTTAVMIAVD